jgi:DNA topoisomerase-1
MTTLVIVESPAKCNKIESFLGPGYKCLASYGHIQELNGLSSIDFNNNYNPQFLPCSSKKNQIEKLRSNILSANDVILATDDDREGEAIAWHICKLFDLDVYSTKRIIFHEITKSAIENAVKNPSKINLDIVNAQQARQILDLIVGFKISPILWKHIVYKSEKSLSAGRCQTPALRLVYENQKEIENSPGKMVYNTIGYFTKMNLATVLNNNFDNKNSTENFLEESVSFEHIFHRNPIKKTNKNPPTPFTTSTLQQSASNDLHVNPKETMVICQKLYEQGYITYMRTDSTTYSKEFIATSKKYIIENYGSEYVNKNIESLSETKSKGKKDVEAQEAHEAIRPVKVHIKEIAGDFTTKEKRMYNLIWKNTVASCMEIAQYNSLSIKISAPLDFYYKYSCEQVVFPGWKKVMGYDEENKEFSYLKTIKQDSKIDYNKITSKMTMKELKMHYTEAKLVQMLEKRGIGRPSTFSSLIDKIQERGYVKKQDIIGKKISCVDFELEGDELQEIVDSRTFGNEKQKLVVQSVGKLVLEFLTENFTKLFDYDYTMNMEKELDEIAKGNTIWHNLCRDCDDQIKEESKKFENENIKFSYDFDNKHKLIIGKYGPIIKKTVGEDVSFIKVIEDIDLDKVKNNFYSLTDVIKKTYNKNIVGTYENKEVEIKDGKFGLYIVYNNNNISLKGLEKSVDEITLDDIVPYITKTNSDYARIDENTSIRSGKYGKYLFYKTKKMNRPKFISLNSPTATVNDNEVKEKLKILKKCTKNELFNENLYSELVGEKKDYRSKEF